MMMMAIAMMAIAMTIGVVMTVATEVIVMPLTEDQSKVEVDCEGEYSLK